ncbi:MAG: CidA/LrgA family protein [Clostridium butyricum]|nr:CidA/LrgA family protein [Clostridium butyricum]
MKLFREALIILGIYLLGEFISLILNIPIPGNILGMLILFILLCSKVVKLEDVENVSDFLLSHLAFFFIPAGVGLMASVDIIKSTWVQILTVCMSTTILIIGGTGIIVQCISNKKKINMNEGEGIGNDN